MMTIRGRPAYHGNGQLIKRRRDFVLDSGAPVSLYELARSLIISTASGPIKISKSDDRRSAAKRRSADKPKENAKKTVNGRILVLREARTRR